MSLFSRKKAKKNPDPNRLSMPRGYQALKSLPDDPQGLKSYGLQTSGAVAMVGVRPLTSNDWIMPLSEREVIEGIHDNHGDDQGLVEVGRIATAQGFEGIYSIIKTRMRPAGTQYCLTLHLISGADAVEVQGFFEEQGTTGARDAAVLSYARNEGLVGDHLEGWMRDPYDADHTRGALMNLSEKPDFDEAFPDHPLSLCRKLMAHVSEEW